MLKCNQTEEMTYLTFLNSSVKTHLMKLKYLIILIFNLSIIIHIVVHLAEFQTKNIIPAEHH
jgi:hypothetical protein